jgi:hypothetical protein
MTEYQASGRIAANLQENSARDRGGLILNRRAPEGGNSSKEALRVLAEGPISAKSRDDRTGIELFTGSFGDWTKSLIAIAQALAT